MNQPSIEQITLSIQQYCVSLLADEGFADPRVEALMHYRVENMAHQLTVIHRLPAQVLQDHVPITRYPITLWDHVKMKLGWKYREAVVTLTEHLTFPKVKMPLQLGRDMRVYTSISTNFCTRNVGEPIGESE